MENNTVLKSTPKDVFLHLFNILTFYISIISFITLWIQYINVLFPDPLNFYYSEIANSIRWSTSVLFIAVPAFLITSWFLTKDFSVNPQKRELKLRKWLIYFTLFISAVVIIIDLITFVYNFLSGELTIQFFLKIFVVLFIATAVFGYYIWELRRKNIISKIPKALAWGVAFTVLASIVAGFFIVGTPAVQRDRRFDEQKVGDLQNLQNQIVNYWIQKESLPRQLGQLEDSISGFIVPKDPESDMDYEYNVIDLLSFELCATFKTSSKKLPYAAKEIKPVSLYDSFQQNWDHEAERTCFKRTIDPELYKSQKDGGNMKLPARPIQY